MLHFGPRRPRHVYHPKVTFTLAWADGGPILDFGLTNLPVIPDLRVRIEIS